MEWSNRGRTFYVNRYIFARKYAPKTIFTFLPQVILILIIAVRVISDVGNLSSKFERCTVFRFRVNGQTDETNRLTVGI